VILLDTNVISALRRPERHPRVAAWLRAQDEARLRLSALTIGEIARGVALEARRNPDAGRALAAWLDATCALFGDRIVPFTAEAARVWGRLSAEIGHAGVDLQIAATALTGGLVVATRNTADFAATGVALIDPFPEGM
jgi:predicted nucleic acid-binding protein